MNQIKNSSDRNRAINILENAFYNVPGIMWMIKSTKNRRRDLRIFLSFCFDQTSEKEGAYLTSDKNGVVFFYDLQKKPNKLLDFFRKLYLILMVIGVKTSIRIMKTRERVDQVRPKRGWYGWFLATEKETIGIRAAYEIRRDMFRMADETNEPIYVETTLERPCSRSKRFVYLLSRHPVSIALGYFVTFLFGMCLRSFTQNFKKHWDSLLALVVHAGLGLMIFFLGGIELFMLAFLMPALVSGCIGSYLFFAQHNYPGVIHHRKEDWSHYKAAITSSSYIKMNWLMEWFTANIGYHHIHHLNAAIPFYNLPKAHHDLPQLKIQIDTTLHPLDILKCLRLKLWDPCLNRMIGMEDLRPLNLKDESELVKPILHGLSNH